jgi:hypothetical protein
LGVPLLSWQIVCFFCQCLSLRPALSSIMTHSGTLNENYSTTMGQCYDHKFLQFSTNFGEKIGAFLETRCYDDFLH